MFITKKHLDRRTFLRGAFGTAIALPLLDAMVPAATAQTLTAAGQRTRFGAIYMPNGVYPGLWHPTKAGKNFEFNRTMKPLEPYRDYLTTVSRLKAPEGRKDMGGIHMGASAAFLNGTGPLGHNGDFNLIESKKSIDQYIADAIAGDTPLRSLELGTEDMGTSAGACDGYPCVFFNTMSWYDDSSPAAGEAEYARLRHARDVPAAKSHRREGQRDPRRVPDEHPPRRRPTAEDAGTFERAVERH
jgi:hypothetical protein